MLKLITFDKPDLLIGLSILVCFLFVFWRQRRGLPYLLFFSIFWLYLLVLLLFKSRFHAIDINDAIFSGLGVLIVYAIFRVFAWLYVEIAEHFDYQHKWFLADTYGATFYARDPERSKNA